jgi:hypothetical protein
MRLLMTILVLGRLVRYLPAPYRVRRPGGRWVDGHLLDG